MWKIWLIFLHSTTVLLYTPKVLFFIFFLFQPKKDFLAFAFRLAMRTPHTGCSLLFLSHCFSGLFDMLSRFSCAWFFAIPGLWLTRLLCPWKSPGKNTGVGRQALLQGILLSQGSNLHLLRLLRWQAGSLPLAPPGLLNKHLHSSWASLFVFLLTLILGFAT